MNSKMIAIIAVVAMCGAALVGVGYAYTSTLDNEENGTATLKYVTLSDAESAKVVSKYDVMYDTKEIGGTVSYKLLKNDVANDASGLTAYALTITPTGGVNGNFNLYMKAENTAMTPGDINNKMKISVWYSKDNKTYTLLSSGNQDFSAYRTMQKLNSDAIAVSSATTVYLKVSLGNEAGDWATTTPSASIDIDFTFQVTDQNSAQEYA